MVSMRFSVVLVAVAVVLCAEIMAAPSKTNRHGGSRSSSSQSPRHGHGHKTSSPRPRVSGGHRTSNNHRDSYDKHPSSGPSDKQHSSDLGSSFSHYDTPPRTTERTRRRGSSSSQHGDSDDGHQDRSSLREQETRRGRGGKNTDEPKHGQKTNEPKKGFRNFLSRNIDLGSIWNKLKDNATECIQKSQGPILNFVTDTVGKSLFGACTEVDNFAKLQGKLVSAKKALSTLTNNQKKPCETTEDESYEHEQQKRDVSQEEDECEKIDELNYKISKLMKKIDGIDTRKFEECWHNKFGENLGTAGISSLAETILCTTMARLMG